MKLKKITPQSIKKKIKDGEMEDGIFCACVETSKFIPIGADKELPPQKLIIGAWVKDKWQWVGLPASLHNLIYNELFDKKANLNKIFYFYFVNTKPHPLKEAYDYLLLTHNYELAVKLNAEMKGKKLKKKLVEDMDTEFHIDVQGNMYHIETKDKDKDYMKVMKSLTDDWKVDCWKMSHE